jgi:hypothetical protein
MYVFCARDKICIIQRGHPAANICIQLEIPATFLKHEIAGPHKYPEIFNKFVTIYPT